MVPVLSGGTEAVLEGHTPLSSPQTTQGPPPSSTPFFRALQRRTRPLGSSWLG